MSKFQISGFILAACLCLVALAGYSQKSGNTLFGETKIAATPKPTPKPTVDTRGVKVNEKEKELDISVEKKAEFIQTYGKDTYHRALRYCYDDLEFNYCSPVAPTAYRKYKKHYGVTHVDIPSRLDNHKIPAEYLTIGGDEKRDTVIFVHGHTCSRYTNMSIAEKFLKKGYNILTFDLPRCGDNKAKFSTFGGLEKYELMDCVNYIDKKIDQQNKILVWGGSYGGVVVSTALGQKEMNEKVDAAILDCPLSSMRMVIGSQGAGDKSMDACDKFLKFFYGFDLDDADGTVQIKKTTVPVLVFEGGEDDTIPSFIVESLYRATPHKKKQLKIYEDSGHCCGSVDHTEDYMQVVKDFVAKNCEN